MMWRNETGRGQKVRTMHIAKGVNLEKDVLAFKKAADSFVRKATISEKAANKTMIRLGIQDAKGNLTKQYK